jgi:hypothetical protein
MIAGVVQGTPVSAVHAQASSTRQSNNAFLLVLAAVALVLLVASAAFAPLAEPETANAAAQWVVGP